MNELLTLPHLNLRFCFTTQFNDWPSWSLNQCGIYYILNLVNNKGYVGQAKNIAVRIAGDTWMCHYGAYVELCKLNQVTRSNLIYRAIHKYGSRNFEVYYLETQLNPSELNEREVFYVNHLHSYKDDNGYNMTFGGDDTSHLNSIESIRKRSTHEAAMKRVHTQIIRYGSLPCNTPESVRRRIELNKLHHGGVLACNSPEVVQRELEKNGGVRNCNTQSSVRKRSITRIFSSINRIIGIIKSNSLELNYYNYFTNIHWNTTKRNRHINYIRSYLSDLTSDSRWTNDMSVVFEKFINHA